jgi:hypothetical protein
MSVMRLMLTRGLLADRGARPLVVPGLRHGHRPSRHDSVSHRHFGSRAVSTKQLKVAWDIIHRAGGSEVIRYENGDPISMGVFSGRNDAWGALGRDRARLFGDPLQRLGGAAEHRETTSSSDSLVEERPVIESWEDER